MLIVIPEKINDDLFQTETSQFWKSNKRSFPGDELGDRSFYREALLSELRRRIEQIDQDLLDGK